MNNERQENYMSGEIDTLRDQCKQHNLYYGDFFYYRNTGKLTDRHYYVIYMNRSRRYVLTEEGIDEIKLLNKNEGNNSAEHLLNKIYKETNHEN